MVRPDWGKEKRNEAISLEMRGSQNPLVQSASLRTILGIRGY